MTSIEGTLLLWANSVLSDVNGLSALSSLSGTLDIAANAALINFDGLTGLKSIAGTLKIARNAALTNVDGLAGLTSIPGTLSIGDFRGGNSSLTNIDGLVGLTSIAGSLEIRDNNSLTNIDGLLGLTSIDGTLRIRENVQLSDCCILRDFENSPGFIFLSENATGCNSLQEIEEADCEFPDSTDELNNAQLKIYPNPARDKLTIEYSGTTKITNLELIDLTGKIIKSFPPSTSIQQHVEMQDYEQGIYILRAQIGTEFIFEKLVVN